MGMRLDGHEVSCTCATPSPPRGDKADEDSYLVTNIVARTSGKQPLPWV